MKRILIVLLPIIAVLVLAVPIQAAPNGASSHVAQCATSMGGQHVAQCAKSLEQGVSGCASMS